MMILDEQLTFTPRDDKSNYAIDFTLPETFETLCITCHYTPKSIEDATLSHQAVIANIGKYVPRRQFPLYRQQMESGVALVNLLTFSLDCDDAYIGCAHRHPARQKHRLSATEASPGFVPHPIRPGRWRAVINIHSITSPEVHYHLSIKALKEGETA